MKIAGIFDRRGWNLTIVRAAGLGLLLSGTQAHADVAAGQVVFKSQCAICHSVQPGRKLNGPSLYGVVGRKAGTEPGFNYSAANRDSGLTWDAPTLERYLDAPRTVVPHTLMSYQGLHDATKRADLIDYLSTLH